MGLCSRSEGWTSIFYIAHAFSLVSAIIILAFAVSQYLVEHYTLGEFNLNISKNSSIMYYISAVFLVITIIIGIMAQKKPEKSSYWVAYCIMLAMFSFFVFFGSIFAASRAGSSRLAVEEMKHSMGFYADNSTNATKWDNLHNKYECCGTEGYQDWQDVRYGRTSLRVPPSCCRPKRRKLRICGLNLLPYDAKANKKIYTRVCELKPKKRGCHNPARLSLRVVMGLTSVTGILIAIAHTLLAILSCYLVINKKV